MFKRIVSLAVMAVMVFALSACNGGISLDDYKSNAKDDLEEYVYVEGGCDYSEMGWEAISIAVTDGKMAIDAAKNNSDVNKALNDAKDAIDELATKFYGSGIQLDDEHRLEILDLYNSWAISEFGQDYPIETRPYFYYSQYNGFYVFRFGGWSFAVSEEEIDGLVFFSYSTSYIYAIKNDMGGTLKEKYEEGHLTRSELEKTHSIHFVYCAMHRLAIMKDR